MFGTFSLTKLLTFLLSVAVLVQCFENPTLEIVVVIKASTGAISPDYFTSSIVPFLSQLYLVFPTEVNNANPDYVRISINVGGETIAWPVVTLQNQTRSDYIAALKALTPLQSGSEADGNQKALQSALQTYHSSSVALNRITILLTDKVVSTDDSNDFAVDLQLISDQIFVIGIPSKANPNFYDSIPSAGTLAGVPSNVYTTLDSASAKDTGVSSKIEKLILAPIRTCQGVIFLNEGTSNVGTADQAYYALMQNVEILKLAPNVSFSTELFHDLLVDNFVFLHTPKTPSFRTSAGEFDNQVAANLASVYRKLVEINKRVRLAYMAIVILSQADSVTNVADTTAAMAQLASQPNVDVFVFDTSKDVNTGLNFFNKVTSVDKIVNVRGFNNKQMSAAYENLVKPRFLAHKCYGGQVAPPSHVTAAPPSGSGTGATAAPPGGVTSTQPGGVRSTTHSGTSTTVVNVGLVLLILKLIL